MNEEALVGLFLETVCGESLSVNGENECHLCKSELMGSALFLEQVAVPSLQAGLPAVEAGAIWTAVRKSH